MRERYVVSIVGTSHYVIDTDRPEREGSRVIYAWDTNDEPNAAFLARDFCERHNAKESPKPA